AGQPGEIRPMLLGVDAAHVTLQGLNTSLVKEAPADLEAVLPSVFNLVAPLLGPPPTIALPSLAGVVLAHVAILPVPTAQADVPAIYSNLGATTLSQLAGVPFAAAAAAPQSPSTGRARLVSVETPEPDRIRGALLHEPDGALPRVTFDVDTRDAAGREL